MALSKFEESLLDFFQDHAGEAFRTKELANRFNYRGSKNYKKLVKALAYLERTGQIQLLAGGKFTFKEPLGLVEGTYRANDRGFGFITYDPDQPDLFVPARYRGNAMDGDLVEAKVIKEVDPATGKGSEAEIIRIVERSASQLVGVFHAYNRQVREETGYLGEVEPQGQFSANRIKILEEGIHPAHDSIVVVKIKDYPTKEEPNLLTGLVAKEIGHKDAPGADILAILFQFGIPHEFPQEVLDQAAAIDQEVGPEDLEGRVDCRSDLVVTIDGADAKDLDDAIAISRYDNGDFDVSIHIADVSYYVPAGTPMDAEALDRGNSVYLTDRVVPMLPQRLSNGICSLLPDEDRLTLNCQMRINHQGRVTSYKIYPAVIRSSYRLTYDEVNAMIEGDEAVQAQYPHIQDMVRDMVELHEILEAMRERRGALNFDAPEAQIIVDEEGHPLDIVVRERHTAERLIESFMLVANETVAAAYTDKDLPLIYRIHEQPDSEKMDRFAEFITSFGVILRGSTDDIRPKQLQEALKQVQGEPYEQAVSTMMLRSMQQAKYSEEPSGHYGLAAQDYTHFTAPIRRYSDLMVHRLIHQYLTGRPKDSQLHKIESRLPEIADKVSKTERRAVEAERETEALKKAEYMVDKVDQEFAGVISSITSFGMFIQLPNTVEGLIRLDQLDDFYQFNPAHLMLIGERTGKVFRIGQSVTVKVTRVDVAEREIDFELLDAEPLDDVTVLGGTDVPSKKKSSKSRGKKGGKRRTNSSKQKSGKSSRSGKADRSQSQSKPKHKGKGKKGKHPFKIKKRK
ncbi:ribonuclease R [Hutsoniella sourekii]|uniref:ribonuclease R n=1 Tax=Hutsoniella sourekii TaxID=87650 RepID=UPI0004AEB64C|nr:ribonuclease R [Hutsoniella sourekii]